MTVGYTLNRIPDEARLFTTGVSSVYWYSPTYGTTFPYSLEEEKFSGVGSIDLNVNTGFELTYNLNPTTDEPSTASSNTTIEDRGYGLEAFVWVKVDTPIKLSLELDLHHIGLSGAVPPVTGGANIVYIDSGDWVLLRSKPTICPIDVHNFGCVLHLNVVDTAVDVRVLVSYPCIYGQVDFVNNPVIQDVASYIPGIIKQTIPEGDNPTYALGRFIEVLISTYGDVYDKLNAFAYADISQGFSESDPLSKSTLVNPDAVLRAYTDWLAQFTGTRVAISSVSSTPWGNFEGTWDEIDAIDTTTDLDDSVEWEALENSDPQPVGVEEFIRWQIKNGYYGYRAGTYESIVESVKRVLSGTKYVGIQASIGTPFIVTVYTLMDETPGVTSTTPPGSSIPEIEQILAEVRPLGIQLSHSADIVAYI